MTDSNLLKYARARDDQNFVWRIAAAMMVRAQEMEFWELSQNSKSLVNWTLNNPMIAPAMMVNHVSTNPVIAAKIVVTPVLDTSNVLDDDIQFVVNEKWDRVADSMFTNIAPVEKQINVIANNMPSPPGLSGRL